MNFLQFISGCGVMPPNVIDAGKWQRCATLAHPRKKNASIKLSEDGKIGFVHDFATMAEPVIWRPDRDDSPVRINHEEIKSRIAAKRRELIAATKAAREFYASCSPLRDGHPYLIAKELDMTGCNGLRVDARGNLVIPMRLNGALISVQRINADGTKLFWSGATTNGTSYTIERKGATITLMCEGLATGLTLFSAMPNARVVVAFNAGNLPRAAVHVGMSGLCAVCADNDHGTFAKIGKNPGVDAATAAAEIIGCGIIIPGCEAGTDFDDWRQELLVAERQNNMFRSWKSTPAQMLANVHGVIRSQITSRLTFIAHNSELNPQGGHQQREAEGSGRGDFAKNQIPVRHTPSNIHTEPA